MANLTDKKLSIWNGLNPDIFLPDIKYTSIEKVANDEIQLRMLNKGRIDAAIGLMPDMVLAAEKLNLELPKVSPKWIIPRSPTKGATMVCHNTPENQAFIKQFNANLTVMKESGRLREIMGPLVDIGDGQVLPYK